MDKPISKPYLENIYLDIIIPILDQSEYTINCIRSIRANTSGYRIIIINNGSLPKEWKRVNNELIKQEDFIVLSNSINLGCVKAVNLGLARSTAQYICILNNDTELPKGWSTEMIAEMNQGDFDMIGPVSSSDHGRQSMKRFFTELPPIKNSRDLDVINLKIRERNKPVLEQHQMIAFFCVIMRRELIEKVGYISEEFGVGFGDDDDYCIRTINTGFRIGVTQRVLVLHVHRSTFKKVFGDETRRNIQNHNIRILRQKYPDRSWPYVK